MLTKVIFNDKDYSVKLGLARAGTGEKANANPR